MRLSLASTQLNFWHSLSTYAPTGYHRRLSLFVSQPARARATTTESSFSAHGMKNEGPPRRRMWSDGECDDFEQWQRSLAAPTETRIGPLGSPKLRNDCRSMNRTDLHCCAVLGRRTTTSTSYYCCSWNTAWRRRRPSTAGCRVAPAPYSHYYQDYLPDSSKTTLFRSQLLLGSP